MECVHENTGKVEPVKYSELIDEFIKILSLLSCAKVGQGLGLFSGLKFIKR